MEVLAAQGFAAVALLTLPLLGIAVLLAAGLRYRHRSATRAAVLGIVAASSVYVVVAKIRSRDGSEAAVWAVMGIVGVLLLVFAVSGYGRSARGE